MKFIETGLSGAYLIELEFKEDDRGYFARSYCSREFQLHGINTSIVQCSISHNTYEGTLRGLHYQKKPFEESKLVHCTRGAIWDVIVDIRDPKSPTFIKWYATELTSENHRILYVPEGFAHGFITLQDNTEVFYQISEQYMPEYSNGIRWDDPEIAIEWPINPTVMTERDKKYPCLSDLINTPEFRI